MEFVDFVREKGQTALARDLDVTQGLVWQWVTGRRPIAAHHCRRIAELSDGRVSVHTLRPDVFGVRPAREEAA